MGSDKFRQTRRQTDRHSPMDPPPAGTVAVPFAAPSNKEGTPRLLELPVRLPNNWSCEPSEAEPARKMLTFIMLSVLLGVYMSPAHHTCRYQYFACCS